MPQISAANLCMLQIFVAYTSMTRVSSFENGRNEKIMSYYVKLNEKEQSKDMGWKKQAGAINDRY